MEPIRIRLARDLSHADRQAWIKFAGSAQRKDGDAIGWLPWSVYSIAADQGRLITATVNGDRVGYLLWSMTRLREIRINQIWLRQDARMQEYGAALSNCLYQTIAPAMGAWQLRAWVATDLPAVHFWRATDWTEIGWRYSKAVHKQRPHYLFTKPLPDLGAKKNPHQQGEGPERPAMRPTAAQVLISDSAAEPQPNPNAVSATPQSALFFARNCRVIRPVAAAEACKPPQATKAAAFQYPAALAPFPRANQKLVDVADPAAPKQSTAR